MVARTDPEINNVPTEAENIIEGVQLLHAMAVPPADIARRLHLDQASVLFVIQHGKLPARQMELQWKKVPE